MAASGNRSLKTMQDEMAVSLGEWGIRRGEIRMHTKYYDDRMEETKEYFQSKSRQEKLDEWNELLENAKRTNLPSDRIKAVEHVLMEELDVEDKKIYYNADDKLGLDFSPYFRRYNRTTQRPEYAIKFEYQKFKKWELDPLQRFDKVEYEAFEWFNHIWFGGARDSLQGNVFEGLVAHHLEKEMACYSCKHRNCLRWNGGWATLSAWADMICCRTECQAIYEIKSKASDDKVEKGFGYNSFRGGSFRAFCAHPSSGKRYIVIVSRSETLTNQGMAHRVSIAEIDYIRPRLCSDSFIETDHSCRIISEVVPLRTTVKKQWCLLPTCQFNFIQMAEDVYINRFGEKKWLFLQPTTSKDGNATNQKLHQKDHPQTLRHSSKSPQEHDRELANLKAAVEDLKIGSKTGAEDVDEDLDDWETMH